MDSPSQRQLYRNARAEASRFAGYADHSPRWFTLVVELAAGTSVAQLKAAASARWLHVPPVYTSADAPPGLRFCTPQVRPVFFKHIGPGKSLEPLVKRFVLGMPLGAKTAHPAQPDKTLPAPA